MAEFKKNLALLQMMAVSVLLFRHVSRRLAAADFAAAGV